MKVIFLDIDGVLNCRSTREEAYGFLGIENEKVELLKKIVDKTKAKIVLVSTWKDEWEKGRALSDIGQYMIDKLKMHDLEIFDKTKDILPEMAKGLEICNASALLSRGEGIFIYLLENEIDGYVILDDRQFDYDRYDLTDNLVKTNMKTGLDLALTLKAIDILKRKLP